jgi:hypothetical protein
MNWKQIANEDKRLREAEGNASEALARYRYDNTIGAGVGFSEYARQVGVHEYTVRKYAKGCEIRISEPILSISDALVKASTSAERFDVVEAIAEARNVTPKAIQAHHTDEVRRVQAIARERADKEGTTVKEEASKLAQVAVRQERAETTRREERYAKKDLRYLELERHLGAARRALSLAVAVDADLDDEHKELLASAIGVVRELLTLVDLRFVGAANVDWDAELSRLNGGT